ncbi:MAG TPA: 3-hydroxyanthranilate 3,4-dioxygenase [Burkholderiales bacterium]
MSRLQAPFSQKDWIEKNLPHALGAIGNKEMFRGSDFIYQVIRGPNARNDFHLDPFDEIFYQLQGGIAVHVMEEGRERVIPVKEGEVFLLPRGVYHSPRRPAGTLGLVLERPRKRDELDAVAWFCARCANKLHEVRFWCEDIEQVLAKVVKAFNADLALRTCKRCGAVLPDPTQP